MLKHADIIAFLATADSAKARQFYEDVIGLEFQSEDDFAIVFRTPGVQLRVQKVPELTPQQHTVLGWSVMSIEDTVKDLKRKGVELQRYGYLEQNEDGVWQAPSGAKIAWFKDPDGNLLSLTEPAPS